MAKRMLGPRPCRLQLVYKVLIFYYYLLFRSLLKLIRNLKLTMRLFFFWVLKVWNQSLYKVRTVVRLLLSGTTLIQSSWHLCWGRKLICWINECLTNQYRGEKPKQETKPKWIWNTTNGLANLSSWCAIFCIWCRGLQLELLHYYVTYV